MVRLNNFNDEMPVHSVKGREKYVNFRLGPISYIQSDAALANPRNRS